MSLQNSGITNATYCLLIDAFLGIKVIQTYLKMDSSLGETATISCQEGSFRIERSDNESESSSVCKWGVESIYFLEGENINSLFFSFGTKLTWRNIPIIFFSLSLQYIIPYYLQSLFYFRHLGESYSLLLVIDASFICSYTHICCQYPWISTSNLSMQFPFQVWSASVHSLVVIK